MIITIIAVLVVLWLLGVIGNFGGNLIHALLIIAALVFLYDWYNGRRRL